MVSRPRIPERDWVARPEYEAVRGYFHDWDEVGMIDDVPKDGDSSPRDLYSILFKNPHLRRVPIEDIDLRGDRVDSSRRRMEELAGMIASGDDFDLFSTSFYERWAAEKEGKWNEKTLRRFVRLKFDMMRSVMEDGLLDPILVERDSLALCDGGHRLTMIKALGYKSVIVREI
jgi:hypothetical protein